MATIAHTYRKEHSPALPSRWLDVVQVIGCSLLMGLCSQIQLMLPFTPVPITFQTLAVLLIGASLGSRKGACAILCYYAQVLIGLPVLAGGLSNPLVFLGPKGGYVLGWVLQAFMMGWFAERALFSKAVTLFVGGLVACAVQMAMGMFVLAQFVGWHAVCLMGLYPFIPGEIFKVMFVSFSLKSQNISS